MQMVLRVIEYVCIQLNWKPCLHSIQRRGFEDRINEIDIDVFHKVQRVFDQEELERSQNATYFGEALGKWCMINKKPKFQEFAREVAPYKKSLPILLYNKDKVLQIIVKHLRVYDPETKELLEYVTPGLHFISLQYLVLWGNWQRTWGQSSLLVSRKYSLYCLRKWWTQETQYC